MVNNDIEKTIKPCPFCGGEAKLMLSYSAEKDTWFTSVRCGVCYSKSKSVMSHNKPDIQVNEVIECWNKRI